MRLRAPFFLYNENHSLNRVVHKKAYGDDKNKTKEEKILHLHEVSG